jgi:hypothetical protein
MFRPVLGLTLALLALAVSPGSGGTMTAPVPSTPPPRWEPLLAWLPEDTETLIVSPLGFVVPKPVSGEKEEKPDYAKAFQFLPIGPLLWLKDDLLHKELAGLKVLCVVEGSRRFTRPGEFGMMPYEGCHILQFDPEADGTLKKVFRLCQEKADKQLEVAGTKVAVFTEQQGCDQWSYFVCRPRPGVLICATNQDYLEETLKRMESKPTTRALPPDLPEWKHVDSKACVWAIRHYRKETAKEDPSSPLNPAGEGDLDARGLVFWMSAESGNVAQVRYLSTSKEALKFAKTEWEVLGLSPKIKLGAPGVVEITISISKEETASFFFVLMMRLGHGIVV